MLLTTWSMNCRFAQLIWQEEPISSGDLVKLCEKEMIRDEMKLEEK